MLLFELRASVAVHLPGFDERALRAFFILRFLSPAITDPAGFGVTGTTYSRRVILCVLWSPY